MGREMCLVLVALVAASAAACGSTLPATQQAATSTTDEFGSPVTPGSTTAAAASARPTSVGPAASGPGSPSPLATSGAADRAPGGVAAGKIAIGVYTAQVGEDATEVVVGLERRDEAVHPECQHPCTGKQQPATLTNALSDEVGAADLGDGSDDEEQERAGNVHVGILFVVNDTQPT